MTTSDDADVEAVARVLCATDSPLTDVEEHWDAYTDDARAALTAFIARKGV